LIGDSKSRQAGQERETNSEKRDNRAKSSLPPMNIPRYPPGVYIRWLALLGILSYFLYFITLGIKSHPPEANAVYICDTNIASELIQCQGLDDETSCADLVDVDGNVATCIQSSCGYKLFDMLDVSVAGSSDPFSSESANDPTSFLSIMSIFYSLVPYLVGFIYGVTFLITGSLIPLTRLLVLGVLAVMNDEVLKNVVVQRRPIGSCLYFKSFGMPSGHAATSIGLLTYLLLELFVFHPNVMFGLTCQKKGRDDYYFVWGYGWQRRENNSLIDIEMGNDVGENSAATNDEKIADVEAGHSTFHPANDSNVFTSVQHCLQGRWKHHMYAFLYCLLFLPVPFSRVYLYDHFKNQVLLGSIEGILIASIWYLGVIRICGLRFMKWLSLSSCASWFGLEFGQSETHLNQS
jgi:membrane-associated phospholipid phosphatase